MAKDAIALITLPPPWTGPEVANEMLFSDTPDNLLVLRVNPPGSQAGRGSLSPRKVLWFAGAWFRYAWALLWHRPRTIYLTITATRLGWLRDLALLVPTRILRKRLVLHMRGGHFHHFYAHAGWLRGPVRWAIRGTDVMVQSESLRRQFAGLDCRMFVIPNPVAETTPSPRVEREDKAILFIGWLTVSKGLDVLADAMCILWKEMPEIRLILVGQMPNRETNVFWDWETGEPLARKDMPAILRNLLQTGCVEHHPVLLGQDKAEAFARATLFVLPSRSEGMSMAVLEAMASGCPVITTRVGGAIDLVEDGENGLLVPPGDPEKLASAMLRLLGNRELREGLAWKARERIGEFRLEKVKEQLLGLILGQKPA